MTLRVRALTSGADGALYGGNDYSFGHGAVDFYADERETVGQIVLTRLRLWEGEWFVDTSDGTPYETQVLGTGTQGRRDMAIQERILGSPGVVRIAAYSSSFDGATRTFTISGTTIDTIFGQVAFVAP